MAAELSLKELKDILDDNELDLSVRDLNTIPKALLQLPRATEIDLGVNKITFIYPEFCNLTRITRLELGSNKLVVLPDNIGNLVNLQHLNLYNNQIEELPLSFANLSSLNWLDLKKNPLAPNLAKAAGNCGSEKECKQAAVGVISYMKQLRKSVNESKAKQQKVHQNVQAINEAQQQEKKKKKQQQNQGKKNGNAAPAPNLPQEDNKSKRQEGMAKSSKRTEVKEKKKCNNGCFITNFVRFILKIAFYASLLAFGVSTCQILFNCVEGGKKIPGSAPLCADLTKLSEFKKPSDKFLTNGYNTYGVVFTSYKKTATVYWNAGTKQVNIYYKQFAKSSTGKSVESFLYKAHAFIMDKTLAIQRWVSLQTINVKKWYDREGHKMVGNVVENLKVASKIVFEIVKDFISYIAEAATIVYHRMESFLLVAQKQGFAKAIETLTAH